MKKVICKKVYDTELAKEVKKFCFGAYGDSDGYEETLYITEDGYYFLYENGGENSIHPTENIRRMSKATAEQWESEH